AIGENLTARRNRAMVYQAQGRRAEAWELLAALEIQLQAHGNQAEHAEVWQQQAELMAEDDQLDLALARYQQAGDLFARTGNRPAVADCAHEQGWLLLRRGKLDQACMLFQSALPELEQH